MLKIKKQYLFVLVFLFIVEILWLFVMYKTLKEPLEKTSFISNERLREGTVHDILWEDGTLVVTGEDPYLVLDCPQGIIDNIVIQCCYIEGINQIACYYDTGNGYTESHKMAVNVTDKDISLELQRFAKTVRIDFEDVDGIAAVQPDHILVEYAHKNGEIFLLFHVVLTLLFDWMLIRNLSKQKYFWLGSAMKAIAFMILQFFIFRAYMIASGAVIIIVFSFEVFMTVCIISIHFGGIEYAKE